ncbi:MAG TPA: hypothetical protein VF996_01255, partial [Candidatus Saccharimonadales bacterium]
MNEQIYKFGGTSNATAEAVDLSMKQGREGAVTVVSAPGKLSQEQVDSMEIPRYVPEHFFRLKITEQLEATYEDFYASLIVPQMSIESIKGRYRQIVTGLGLTALKGSWLEEYIPRRIETGLQTADKEAFNSLGEDLIAEVYQAAGFKRLPLPSSNAHPLDSQHREDWKSHFNQHINSDTSYVLDGNRYLRRNGIGTYLKGGSDVSGALAAYALNADVYRNSTDTAAQSADPEIIKPADRLRSLRHLTYREIRELGLNGTGLLHPNAAVPLINTNIRTEIRNTFDPSGEYTLITDHPTLERVPGQVEAISLIKDVAVFEVYEPGAGGKDGWVDHFAAALKSKSINMIDTDGFGGDTQLFIVDSQDKD